MRYLLFQQVLRFVLWEQNWSGCPAAETASLSKYVESLTFIQWCLFVVTSYRNTADSLRRCCDRSLESLKDRWVVDFIRWCLLWRLPCRIAADTALTTGVSVLVRELDSRVHARMASPTVMATTATAYIKPCNQLCRPAETQRILTACSSNFTNNQLIAQY